MSNEFYTVKQLAAKLGVSPMTIYRMTARGDLPVHQIGGQKRYMVTEIDGYLASTLRGGGDHGDS